MARSDQVTLRAPSHHLEGCMAKMLVPLQVLVAEGFASSASAMWDYALDHELPVALDGKGRACMAASAADRLRQERREAEAREARQAELRRQERQDAEIAALVAQEKRQQLLDRRRRLEQEVGPVWAIVDAMRKADGLQPGVYTSVEEQAELARREYSIDEVEEFARREFGYGLDPVS